MANIASPAKPVKHTLLKVLIGLLGGGLILFAAYIWLAFQYSYSDGERAGFVQKFSRKGWLCKTWEGELALVAMPDPVFGEKACAFVVTKPGEQLEFDELIAFLKSQRIASFKLPERLELVDHFPTSLVGKILKRQLRDMIAERVKTESAAGPGG